jgi:hypothetical protein
MISTYPIESVILLWLSRCCLTESPGTTVAINHYEISFCHEQTCPKSSKLKSRKTREKLTINNLRSSRITYCRRWKCGIDPVPSA